MDQEVKNQIKIAIEELYANNQSKLKQICNKEMMRFGGISQKDYDCFYSRAGLEISVAMEHKLYDPTRGKTPLEFFTSIIRRSIWKEMTDRNRGKRQNFVEIEETDEEGNIIRKKQFIPTISIDMSIGEEDGTTIKDTLQSDFDVGEELSEDCQDEKIKEFLIGLTKIQRQIAEMIMYDYSVAEIKSKLKLSDKEYIDNFNAMKSFSNISILCNNVNQVIMEEEEMSTTTQTMENCKTDRISIASIIKKIDKHTIRFDHPLQRESDQWSPSMNGNLVSDILQGNKLHPLIFAEQIINGVPIIWDLDGKQRCTNAYSYSNNGYKVSKNIRRWMIKYQTTKKDENGNDILDENGFPIAVNAEFDIRGKKFSDLPEELRDRFLDYSFNYDQYLNCSEEDIGYHIERYNDGKPMTSPQKGITKLGTEYAELVKAISNMPFFKDMGGYKVSEFKNGTINRVVVESIMTSNYLEKWNKFDNMCKHIKENANITVFDDFEDMVERLEKVITDDVSDMFNSKDSFLWFGLFARFVKSETDDKRFIEFMTEFVQSLHSKFINGVSFDDILESSNTKDKGIVTKKMNHLMNLMDEYLVNKENLVDKQKIIDSPVDFVANAVDVDKEVIEEDIEVYEDDLNVLLDNTVKIGAKLRDKENRLSLLAMVAYSYKEDADLDEWFAQYTKRDTYYADQKVNFIHMKNDFEQYCKQHKLGA